MPPPPTPAETLDYRFAGLMRGAAVYGAWLALLVASLGFVRLEHWPWWPVLAIPLQSFLNVGLFITAHDAMHGTLLPRDRRWNDNFGRVCLWSYALFDYGRMRAAHWEHHARPASEHDPDFHPAGQPGIFAWYAGFLKRYVTWRQWAGMPMVFCGLWALGASPLNLLLLWAVPAWLSTFQLFWFGTYLPHREAGGYPDAHRARSHGWPRWVSFATCYHFGRHWEHHEWPSVPWWRLGRLAAASMKADDSARPAQPLQPKEISGISPSA